MVRKITKRIWDIPLTLIEIELRGGILRLCPCRDADMFSGAILRYLLLSDDGREVFAAIAISCEREIKLKWLSPTLDYSVLV